MDRLSKANLLLEMEALNDIWSGLRVYRSADISILDQQYEEKASLESPKSVLNQTWRDEIEQIYEERALCQRDGIDTKLLDQRVIFLKRALREGSQLNEGEILGDRYRLLEVCGRGGFAKVWQAYDREARQIVAIKVMHGDQAEDPRRVERFMRGARILRSLNHPNIIRILDEPMTYAGFVYYVMEYLSGGDLYRAVTAEKITLRMSLQIIVEIGKALEHMHQSGFIHRDVKPQNILLDGTGGVRLADFDLIWANDTTGGTRTGAMGTFVYAAPEEMEDASRVDPRADIFSLSMTAVFAVFGQSLPRQALQNSSKFLRSIDCPVPVKMVLQRGIAWDPAKRHSSIAEFCMALEGAIVNCFDAPPSLSGDSPSSLSLEPTKSQLIFRIATDVVQHTHRGSLKKDLRLITAILLIIITFVPWRTYNKDDWQHAGAFYDNASQSTNAHSPSQMKPIEQVASLPKKGIPRNTTAAKKKSHTTEHYQEIPVSENLSKNSAEIHGPTQGMATGQFPLIATELAESYRLNREEPLKIELSGLVKSQMQGRQIFDHRLICVDAGGWVVDAKFQNGTNLGSFEGVKVRESIWRMIMMWKYRQQANSFCYSLRIEIPTQ